MPLFHYRALNQQGQYQQGDWFGPSKQHLYERLKQDQLQLLSCRDIPDKFIGFSFFRPVSGRDLQEFCVHMAQMEGVKVPINESLLLLAQNHTKKAFKSVLYGLCDKMQQGSLLSQACQFYPKIFDGIFIESFSLAEQTGKFGEAFRALEIYLKKKQEYQQKLKQSLRYPLVLLGGFLLLMAVLMGVFVPPLQHYLQELAPHHRSWALESLVFSSLFLESYGFYGFGFLLLAGVGWYWLCSVSRSFRFFSDQFFLTVPVVGPLRKQFLMNIFLQTLSLLLQGGVKVLPSLQRATKTVGNLYLQQQLSLAIEDVQSGIRLSLAFKDRNLISSFLFRLIQLGEETGNLAFLIQEAAETELENIWNKIKNILNWIEPGLILLMGSLMIWVVAATVIPLYGTLVVFER